MFCVSFHANGAPADERLVMALNTLLPPDIRAVSCRRVPDDFHARYAALGKRYVYLVCNSRVLSPFLYGRATRFWPHIDEVSLDETAQVFVGAHDFKGFCSVKSDIEDTVRTVRRFSVAREGELVRFTVEADGFLYNMVRIMVGTLLSVARGKLTAEDIRTVLRTGRRTNLCMTAPAEGLYLDYVDYGDTLSP